MRPTGRNVPTRSGSVLCLLCAGLLAIGLFGVCVGGCDKRSGTGSNVPRRSDELRVVVTIPPVAGLVDSLLKGSGLNHQLVTLVPPGVSEHGYEVPPDKLAALASADLVVMVGLGMEPQVDKFLKDHPNPSRRVFVLAEEAGVHAEPGAAEHAHDHGDEPDHDDDHHGVDPHVWLDPVLVRDACAHLATAIEELARASGKDTSGLRESATDLDKRVRKMDDEYREALGQAARRTIIVAHDAYGYLAKRYNLDVVAISGLNAGEPQPGDIARAVQTIRDKHLTTIFVEPQLSPGAAERIAHATGAKVAVLDPVGSGDWFAMMSNNLSALKDALGGLPAPDRPASTGVPSTPAEPKR